MALSKIQAESMNLADTYAFTGTVSGAGEANDMKLVETVTVASSNVSSVDFENLSTDYNHFILKIGDFKPTGNGGQILIRLRTTNSSGYASANGDYDCTRTRVYRNGGSYTVNQSGFTANYGVAGMGQNSDGNGYVEATSALVAHFYNVHSDVRRVAYTSTFWGGSDGGNTSHMISGVTFVGSGSVKALTGIRVLSSSGDVAIGSRLSLYGVKT